jgi:predicted NUDIX family NTP pyrophosphohydrolase
VARAGWFAVGEAVVKINIAQAALVRELVEKLNHQ